MAETHPRLLFARTPAELAAHHPAVALRAVLRAAALVAVRVLDQGQLRAVLHVRTVVRSGTVALGEPADAVHDPRRPLHSVAPEYGHLLRDGRLRRHPPLGHGRLRVREVRLPGQEGPLQRDPGRRHDPAHRSGVADLSAVLTGRSHRHTLGGDHSFARQPVRGVPHARIRRGRHPRHSHRGGACRWSRGVPDLLAGRVCACSDLGW